MFPAGPKFAGMSAAFPDVCRVPAPAAPPVPIPYPNVGRLSIPQVREKTFTACSGQNCNATAKASLPTTQEPVCIACYKTATGGKLPLPSTSIKLSSGDEAGTVKGLVSSSAMDKAKLGSLQSKVVVEGKRKVAPLMDLHHGRMFGR